MWVGVVSEQLPEVGHCLEWLPHVVREQQGDVEESASKVRLELDCFDEPHPRLLVILVVHF